MESLIRRGALVCATIVFTALASQLPAQQAQPGQASTQELAPGVPPTPPPETRNTHRWVNTGGYLTPEPRRKSATQAQKSGKKRAKPASSRPTKATHTRKHEVRAAKSPSKAELKRCKGLTSRQLKHNSKCQTALKADKKSTKQKAKPAKSLSKAEARRCQKMNYQQLLRHADCAALLQREVQAGQRTKHGSKDRKAAERSKKSAPAKDKKHQKSSKHRRS